MEVVDEAVLKSKIHTMDVWVVFLSKIVCLPFSSFSCPSSASWVSESTAMLILNLFSSLEKIAVRCSGGLLALLFMRVRTFQVSIYIHFYCF